MVKRVCDEVPGHKQVNLIHGGKTPLLPAAAFHELGMKIVQYSTPALYVAYQAIGQQMSKLREASDLNVISPASATFTSFQRFMDARYVATVHGAEQPTTPRSWFPGPPDA
jgi:2-methylisocitrate lyase-like PEP mutase family enzyme